MSRWIRLRLPVITAMVLAVGAGVHGAEPTKSTTSGPAGTALRKAPASKSVSFVTDDNIVIHAGYTPPVTKTGQQAPMVILLHMYQHDRSTYDPLIPHLHEAGFAVLAMDLRGHGESVGPPELKLAQRVAERDTKLFRNMDRDVAAAYAWLARQPDVDLARFAIVGASVGCSIALRYAAADRSVDTVVCMTPGVRYLDIDSIADISKYGDRPLMLLACADERSAADELSKLARKATVEIVPGGGPDAMARHGTRMFGQVPGIERKITEFLVNAVGPPTTEPVVASIDGEVYHPGDSGTAKRISDKNRRWFSSAAEAETRGLRSPKSRSGKAAPPARSGGQLPDPKAHPEAPK